MRPINSSNAASIRTGSPDLSGIEDISVSNAVLATADRFPVRRETMCVEWRDPESGCTIVAATPPSQRALWLEYLEGAERRYGRHGWSGLVEADSISTGEDTALFFAALDCKAGVVGGGRVTQKLESPEETYSVAAWAGRPGLSQLRAGIAKRIPYGLVEGKTAWVDERYIHARSVANALARTSVHSMALLGINSVMCSAPAHAVSRWSSTGGVVDPQIPAAPYPDKASRLRIMWWDRNTFASAADGRQLMHILVELTQMTPAF